MTNLISKSGLASALDFSDTFPGLPHPCVERSTLIGALEDLIDRDFDLILLEGEEESGKTTALAQFALKHSDRTICLFIRPLTEFTYDPVRIRFDLCAQINWQLFGKKTEIELPDGAQLRYLLQCLERKAIQDRRTIYFVIDGLADIPTHALAVRRAIVEMLPIGARAFRFLLSGSIQMNRLEELPKARVRTQLITALSLDEALSLFGDLLPRAQIEDVYKSCSGRVGRLASVRRLLVNGADAKELVRDLSQFIPEIFDIEWGQLPKNNKLSDLMLAIAAHTPDISCVSIVKTLATTTQERVLNTLKTLPCLRLDPQKETIQYVSESFRKYAAKRLASIEPEILNRVVEHLQIYSSTSDAFRTLPEYLERQGDISKLIAFFSTSTIQSALISCKSIAMVNARLKRAAELAFEGTKQDAGIRYLVQRAALSGILDRRTRRNHVSAALRVQGDAAAQALASATFADEERLFLFAIIARRQRSLGFQPEQHLIEQISRLADAMDWRELREQSVEIASELLPVLPDVGLRILGASAHTDGNANSMDLALVSAFLKATIADDAKTYKSELLKLALESTKSQQIKSIFATATGLFIAENAESLFSSLERLNGTSEKVLLLRMWLDGNSDHRDGIDVALRLIDIMMNDSRYAPNVAAFASALSVVSNSKVATESAQKIVQITEGQLPLLRSSASTVDYFRLLSELAVAQTALGKVDPASAIALEILDFNQFTDPVVRASSFSWVISMCYRLDLGNSTSDELGLLSYAYAELEKAITESLALTAEQSEAFRPLVRPLTDAGPHILEQIVGKLNTQVRRDAMLESIVDNVISRNTTVTLGKWTFNDIVRIANKIEGIESRDLIRRRLVAWSCRMLRKQTSISIDIGVVQDLARQITDPDDRCIALANCYTALDKSVRSDAKVLFEEIKSSWNEIDSLSVRIDCAFSLCTQLFEFDESEAKWYFFEGERLSSTPAGRSSSSRRVTKLMVLLCARALAACERAHAASPDDWNRFREIVQKLSCRVDQANAYAFVSLLIAGKNRQLALDVIQRELKPIIREVTLGHAHQPSEVKALIAAAAPALWLHHSPSVEEFFVHLDRDTRDEAFDNIFDYLLDRRIPQDAWTGAGKKEWTFTYEDAVDAINVASKITSDASLASNLDKLLGALRTRDVEARLNANQRAELLRLIKTLAGTKLPEPLFGIKHEGYIITLDAHFLAAERTSGIADWEQILRRAEALPNAADVVFVISSLTRTIPGRFSELRKRAFQIAAKKLETLPLLEDVLDRGDQLIEGAFDLFPIECKTLAQRLLTLSKDQQRPGLEYRRRLILDFIYRRDESVAASLASVADSDPARSRVNRELKNHLLALKAGDQLRSADSKHDGDMAIDLLPGACWRELGRLNATRSTNRKHEDNMLLVERICDTNLNDAYPIVSFVIEATAIRNDSGRSAAEYLRPFLAAAFEACDLTFVATSIGGSNVPLSTNRAPEPIPEIAAVPAGTRAEALGILESWLSSSRSGYVKICDPYFTADDLDLLQLVSKALPKADISVLTSRKAARQSSGTTSEHFKSNWRRLVSEQSDNYCQITLVGAPSTGLFGIHNRWIILDDLGIDLGTSYGAIGLHRSHIIARLDDISRNKCEREIDAYLTMQNKFWKSERLIYESFALSIEP